MAVITSPVWSVIRGSIAGTTYLSGPHHQIIARQRTAPTQPNTTFQSMMRSSFGFANISWRLLSKLVQGLWDDFAQTVVFEGPNGSYQVTGRELFIAQYATRQYMNIRGLSLATPVTTVPTTGGVLGIVVVPAAPATPSSTGIAVSVTNGSDEDITAMVNVSVAFEESRNTFKGPWSTVRAVASVISASSSGLVEVLGLNTGKIYFTSIRAIVDPPNGGKYSNQFFLRHTAVDVGP